MSSGDGNIYIRSDSLHVEGNGTLVSGSRRVNRDLITLHNLWTPTVQMCQVAPGHKWCRTCADVRPYHYFDVLEWDKRGKATKWEKGKPTEWDGVPVPTKYADECKQCLNSRDPKLRPAKYCSGCKQEKRRAEFGDDERNTDGKKSICYDCQAEGEARRRRQKAKEEGREMRPYAFRTA